MYEMGARELAAVKRVLNRRKFFRYGGLETERFEKELALLMGTKFAFSVTSGTAALITGLMAMGIGPGDSVLVPGYTFISTALAVTSVGAIPIYTEIDETLTMCCADLARKIERHTACVIPVHMQGMPSNMRSIRKIAKANGVKVLEDCCQAAGGSYGRNRLGTMGDMGAFSFNQYKILSCGEGGACVTSDKRLAERAYMAQDGSCSVWPQTGKMSEAFFCGGSFRFNEINAAILRVQLKRMDRILSVLRKTRSLFQQGIRLPSGFKFIKSHDENGNCGVCFLIQAEDVPTAQSVEKMISHYLTVQRPIHSGRHVYSAWDVIANKRGGHHPHWDCFRHPRNKNIRVNYKERMPRTDDYLTRTVLCHTPYGWSKQKTQKTIERINQKLKGFASG